MHDSHRRRGVEETQSIIRVLLADDHTVMRAGTKRILADEPDLLVVGEAATGEEALRLASSVPADVLVLDLGMPGMDGIQVCRVMREQHPEVRVVVLSGLFREAYVRALTQLGVHGYLLKSADPATLVEAIRAAARGGRTFGPEVSRTLDALRQESIARPTRKELEILREIAAGSRNADIAEHLCVSVNTVEYHLRELYRKLDVSSRAEALIAAQRLGWLDTHVPLC
jgi:DNA-binding NarL/FixJ family response regulator